ncbi:MAG: alpha/beta hydrolase [Parvibaculum sp.]|uniref:alpha/beta fold hydrolase n=1 Tax=Parvibaculum sp. TaxID=2024848 RepID=UPI0027309A83|nr:alpha/beta hydrolase [Parvibaculum sp.]MDP2151308.1 alpha/beta hydrolase [Parvibaculum sp.]
MTAYAHLHWRSADGLALHARDYAGKADRAPVVCIHGLTRNARDFEDLAPSIVGTTGRRVIAVDVRGRGASERAHDPMTYNPGMYAADIMALLDDQAIGRAAFIGTSMGGLIMMTLALMRPDAIAAAVLNDVGPEIATEGLARIAGYVGISAEVADWAGAADYVKAGNGAVFPHYGDADWDRMARRTFREEGGRPVLDYDPDIAVPIRAADPAAPAPDLWPLFGALVAGRPALLIRGATSDILSADIAARMRGAAAHMTYAEVPGVGHAPMLDESEAFDAIVALLRAAD